MLANQRWCVAGIEGNNDGHKKGVIGHRDGSGDKTIVTDLVAPFYSTALLQWHGACRHSSAHDGDV
ncbi:hypothetical protein VCRA2116O33_20021 [Vibrio crassostreae]|nr:hypothetical protein VCRA2116O33_20021 [Vibrio crassostreae]